MIPLRPLRLSFIAFCLMLSGCASHSLEERSVGLLYKEPKVDDLFLRGVFNWWEANEAFKFHKDSENSLSATIELIADGQPYDFKVADSTWSNFSNCGLAESKEIELNSEYILVCQQNSLNLIFRPEETGKYYFRLDIKDPFYPTLTVKFVGK